MYYAFRAWIASMGPRFFKRGEGVVAWYLVLRVAASMGPRFFKRGEARERRTRRAATGLQWGHASSSVESPLGTAVANSGIRLQWGHASSSVERKLTKYVISWRTLGFNGATLLQAWRAQDVDRP